MKKAIIVLFATVLSVIAASLVVVGLVTIYESILLFLRSSSCSWNIIDSKAFSLLMLCFVTMLGALISLAGVVIEYSMIKEWKKLTAF